MAKARRRVVVVGNEKGGVGKTTISVNLAAMAAAEHRDVLLVDADPHQQSAAKWAARRRESAATGHPLTCVSLTGRDIRAELDSLSQRYAVVIVDTGAEDSPELRAATLVASVLVVPIQPEPFDLWSLPTIEAIYGKARSLNDRLRVVIAVNRVAHQSAAATASEAPEWIRSLAPGLADASIVQIIGRTAYGRAIVDGMGVAEPARHDAKAANEFNQIYKEAMR